MSDVLHTPARGVRARRYAIAARTLPCPRRLPSIPDRAGDRLFVIGGSPSGLSREVVASDMNLTNT